MKFKANRKEFTTELKKMCGDSVIITANKATQRVILESTALGGSAVQTSFTAEVDEEGRYAQQTKTFLPAVEGTAGDEVLIKTEGEDPDVAVFTVTGEGTRFRLNGVRLSTTPSLGFEEKGEVVTPKCSLLVDVIDSITYAAAPTGKSKSRPILEAANLVFAPGGFVGVATDSYRLAKYEIHEPFADKQKAFVVPVQLLVKAKKDILSKSENKDGVVSLSSDGKKVRISDGVTTVQSPLLFGGYPSVARLIPNAFMTELFVNRQEFADAVDRMSFLKTDNMSIIRLDMTPENGGVPGTINLSSRTQEIGDFEQSIEGKVTGEPLKLSISSTYLADALKRLDCETVRIGFAGEMKPAVITDPDNPEVIHLMLPIRTYE